MGWRRGGFEEQCPRNKDMVLNREKVIKGTRLRETSPPPIKGRYTLKATSVLRIPDSTDL
jgi:hypothetical protein